MQMITEKAHKNNSKTMLFLDLKCVGQTRLAKNLFTSQKTLLGLVEQHFQYKQQFA